jgi:hypothetical protein
MNKKRKLLPRHASHWKYDLPKVGEPLAESMYPNSFTAASYLANASYLEIPRSTARVRGIALTLGISGILLNLYCLWFILSINLESKTSLDVTSTTGSLLIIITFWMYVFFIRLDIQAPRNEPIRFNRIRRKVYFYEFKFDRLRVFSGIHWGVKAEAHAWDDLKAEACSVYAPGHGGLIQNIVIAAHKPGTEEVIARYFFAHDLHHGEQCWAIARLFMQQGVGALPEIQNPPRDWNDDSEVGFPRRFAPKVHWPADIDLESRTAPTEETKCDPSPP